MSALAFDPYAEAKKINARLRKQPSVQGHNVKQETAMNIAMTPMLARGASGGAGHREPPFNIGEGRVLVTPELARRVLMEANYSGQRRVSSAQVANLAHLMNAGEWTPGTQIAFAKLPSGTMMLVNGQHRMHAVIEAGQPQEFSVLIVQARDTDHVNRIYYRFDTVQRNRATNAVLSAVGLREELGISSAVADAAYDAAVIIACGMRRIHANAWPPSLRTPDGRLSALAPYHGQVKEFSELTPRVPKAIRRSLFSGPIVAVAIITLRDQNDKARPFWEGLARDDGLRVGDPRKALINVLLDSCRPSAMNATLVRATFCWKAWFEGRSLATARAPEGHAPYLAGCKVP